MSESPESSHYEIALTNRQVLTVFVILLVCVTLAFFSGVWVGRKGTGIPVESVAAETIQAGVAPGEAPLEELKFFTRDDPEEPAAAEATEPEPAASPEPEPRRRPQAPETVAEAAPAPIVESAEEEPARRPEVTEPRRSAPEPAAAPAPAGTLVVQVFSSRDRDQAQRVVDRLRAGGYAAMLSPVDVEGSTMYRVRIGPYSERDEAQAVADRVRRDFRLETWITQ